MRIQDLPAGDRPREKLLSRGAARLRDRELLAVLLRTGCPGKSAIDLAGDLLERYGKRGLLTTPAAELLRIRGIDSGKAATLLASYELVRRVLDTGPEPATSITTPEQALPYISELSGYRKEHFVVLYLDARNCLIAKETVSVGTVDSSLVHPREVFEPAIRHLASGVILAHNHPSGQLEASAEDRAVTRRLGEAAQLLGIDLVDHLIVAGDRHVSFRQRGWLPASHGD
jgi:DNA repair protein RadC